MNKKYVILCIVLIGFFTIYLYNASSVNKQQETEKGIQFSLSSKKSTYKNDESFIIEVRVRNLRLLPISMKNHANCSTLPTVVNFDKKTLKNYDIKIIDSKNTFNPMSGCKHMENETNYYFFPGQIMYQKISITPKQLHSELEEIKMNAYFHGVSVPFSLSISQEKEGEK